MKSTKLKLNSNSNCASTYILEEIAHYDFALILSSRLNHHNSNQTNKHILMCMYRFTWKNSKHAMHITMIEILLVAMINRIYHSSQ